MNYRFSDESKIMFNKKGKVVFFSLVCLTIIYWFLALWYKNKTAYTKQLVIFYAIFGPIFNYNPWLDFWQYIYQFIMTVIFFAIIPYIIVRYYFKEEFKNYGLTWGNKKFGFLLLIPLVFVLFVVAIFVSQDSELQLEYPLSKLIGINWLVLIFYEISYFFYFFAYEIIMRGYLQWGLKREEISIKSIIIILMIQTMITTLFHIGKPSSEIFLALIMGPIIGYAALKLDSIYYGMILHFIINVFMDFFILYRLDLLPTAFI
ncbi:MAG TPA: CPBP family intramembrane glutamic endopeptidase [Candidatus Lokiarchaeia archaeon]